MTSPIAITGLRVALPDGRVLIDRIDLDVAPGQVVVLLGGSGAGKSTFARVLFEPEELASSGFAVDATRVAVARADLGLVPQRGALFDHLDVRGNLELAIRQSPHERESVETWLARVGLAPELGAPGTPVASLSGGQAQRVAVARVLAGGRRVLFLDEPSVGLDPLRVRQLAQLIRSQVRALGIAAIVVTHDVALAAGVGDRLLMLSMEDRRLVELFPGEWPGALEDAGHPEAARGAWLVRLEAALVDHLAEHGDRPPLAGDGRARTAPSSVGRAFGRLLAPFGVAIQALQFTPRQLLRAPRDFATVAWRVLMQTLVRPLLFYAVVSTLIGYTVLYVISRVGGAGVRPDALIRQIGGSYVIALAPALSALLFVAASGSATNAWLGSMGLTKQTLALEALGIDRRGYLWAPAWLTMGLAYLVVAAVFALGMLAGGLLVCRGLHVSRAWAMLTGDLLDPRPERAPYVHRAMFLVWMYAWGIASDAVAKGAAAKPDADAITRGMTASVIACTLWVVGWELVTVAVVFG